MADSSTEEPRPSGEGTSDGPAAAGASGRDGGSAGHEAAAPHTTNMIQSILAHYSNNITDALLMITRICTILFTFLFLLPFGGGTAFYK